jgi:hypothetical protein
LVIRVEKCDPVPGRDADAGIARRLRAAVGLVADETHARIGAQPQGGLGTVVNDDRFPFSV